MAFSSLKRCISVCNTLICNVFGPVCDCCCSRYSVGQKFGRHFDDSVEVQPGQVTGYTLLVYLSGTSQQAGPIDTAPPPNTNSSSSSQQGGGKSKRQKPNPAPAVSTQPVQVNTNALQQLVGGETVFYGESVCCEYHSQQLVIGQHLPSCVAHIMTELGCSHSAVRVCSGRPCRLPIEKTAHSSHQRQTTVSCWQHHSLGQSGPRPSVVCHCWPVFLCRCSWPCGGECASCCRAGPAAPPW